MSSSILQLESELPPLGLGLPVRIPAEFQLVSPSSETDDSVKPRLTFAAPVLLRREDLILPELVGKAENGDLWSLGVV